MWSVRRVPVTRRAAAFWTDCSEQKQAYTIRRLSGSEKTLYVREKHDTIQSDLTILTCAQN